MATTNESLASLYLRIDRSDSASAVLNVDAFATETEIRDAYHRIALRIHPDKAPSENLLALYTLLFQKVQSAYDLLLGIGAQQSGGKSSSRQLTEGPSALHARNEAFKEALRYEREEAL